MTAGVLASLTIAVTAFTSTAGATTNCLALLCLYEHDGFSGAQVDFWSLRLGQCYPVPSHLNDKISSIDNNTSSYQIMYKHANCGGSFFVINPAAENGGISWPYNDTASSFKGQNTIPH
jgi:hypothetical protein